MALEAMNHIFSEETGQRMAEALDRQNTLLAGIAVGNAGADYIDASFAALLDGTNTQTVFEAWWPLSAGDTVTKYQRLAAGRSGRWPKRSPARNGRKRGNSRLVGERPHDMVHPRQRQEPDRWHDGDSRH